MNGNIYSSPINGELLQMGPDGLLHGASSDLTYVVNSSNQVVPLKSPLNASNLYMGPDGVFYSKHDDVKYIVSDGKIIPLVSPIHGGDLQKGENNLYRSPYDDIQYMVSKDGVIKPLTDPFNGGTFSQNQDGTYQSATTGKNFIYDEPKGAFVPLYIPDDTAEDAHIENGMLVGNESGRRFEIDADGIVMTPQEIAFREIKQGEAERFKQMEEDGTIERYLAAIDQKRREQKPLTIERIREIINNDPDLNNSQTTNNQDNQQVKYLSTSSMMTIQDFLDTNGITNEVSFINYLKGLGMNEKIVDLISITSGTNFMSIFGQDYSAQLLIIENDNGGRAFYVPTTQTSQTATSFELLNNGNARIIENQHSPLMVDGIRYGNVSIVDMNVCDDGSLSLVESHHQVEPSGGLQPVESRPRFVVTSSRTPMTINQNGEIEQGMGINKQSILDTKESGKLKPIQSHEDLEAKNQELRSMGFDEKYFIKPNIAGINYDIGGNETFYKNENLSYIPELGIRVNNSTPIANCNTTQAGDYPAL